MRCPETSVSAADDSRAEAAGAADRPSARALQIDAQRLQPALLLVHLGSYSRRAPEAGGEVTLAGKAERKRDLGQGPMPGFHQAAAGRNALQQHVLMRRTAGGILEQHREVIRAQ